VDWSEKAAGLVELAHDDRDWYEAMALLLLRPGDRVAVDVGCGGGGMTLALAAALGGQGRVVAVDAAAEMLAAVRDQVAAAGCGSVAAGSSPVAAGSSSVAAGSDPAAAGPVTAGSGMARVDLVRADLGDGVAPVRAALDRPADLVWAAASVHHVGDQQAAVDALTGLLAPGGRLALAEGGLPARHLPWDVGVGEPGLELRLEAAHDRWFARMRAELPASSPMPYAWTAALRRAGLVQVTTRTTLRERPVPLPVADRDLVIDRLGRFVEKLRPTGLLDRADLAAWERLLDPDDPAWLGNRDDLQRLDARSVHVGVSPPA
jgi:SAM-dependent methyltransferase